MKKFLQKIHSTLINYQTKKTFACLNLKYAKNNFVKEEQKELLKIKNRGKIKKNNQIDINFDQITHTGQAWDEEDHRLSRFTYSKKLVNPNVAANLINKQKPIACEENIVFCDGGHKALGHPRVYLNLDKPGTHACGYCGIRFYNIHLTHSTDFQDSNKKHILV